METSFDTTHMLLTVFFSSLALGFFIYGRRQRAAIPFITGIALMILPNIFDNNGVLTLCGCGLLAVPYFIRI